jgi:heme oxygenase-like protein
MRPAPSLVERTLRRALVNLLTIYDLHTAPIDRLGPAVQWQHYPGVAALKLGLEEGFVADLDAASPAVDNADAPAALRELARVDLVPDVYEWVAEEADFSSLVEFLALEGGPDGGFDDLVALCQVGLEGPPKVELATNYWDEMGNGDASRVHTDLHRMLADALPLPAIPRAAQPVEVLARAALGGLLATNRVLQPEMVGALGLTELQAGPRCRKVIAGLRRVGAPADALPFYEVHAAVDPKHGRDWVDNAVVPLVEEHPDWAQGIVRGACWRSTVNGRFFDAIAERFCVRSRLSA